MTAEILRDHSNKSSRTLSLESQYIGCNCRRMRNELKHTYVSHACHDAKTSRRLISLGGRSARHSSYKCHRTATGEHAGIFCTPLRCSRDARAQLLVSFTRIILKRRKRDEAFSNSLSNNSLASYQSALAPIVRAKEVRMIPSDARSAIPFSRKYAAP